MGMCVRMGGGACSGVLDWVVVAQSRAVVVLPQCSAPHRAAAPTAPQRRGLKCVRVGGAEVGSCGIKNKLDFRIGTVNTSIQGTHCSQYSRY